MKLIVDLNISWSSPVMSPKDFVTMCEIMDRSVVVDRQYTNENTYYVIEDKRNVESRTVDEAFIVSQSFMDELNKPVAEEETND